MLAPLDRRSEAEEKKSNGGAASTQKQASKIGSVPVGLDEDEVTVKEGVKIEDKERSGSGVEAFSGDGPSSRPQVSSAVTQGLSSSVCAVGLYQQMDGERGVQNAAVFQTCTNARQMLDKMPMTEEGVDLDENTSTSREDDDVNETGPDEDAETEEDKGGEEDEGEESFENCPRRTCDTQTVGPSQVTVIDPDVKCVISGAINIVDGVIAECLNGNLEKRHGESMWPSCIAHNMLEEMPMRDSVP
ncbi:hypothetical protein U1Q18_009987 [Sarracenia purpurea var. burkii]